SARGLRIVHVNRGETVETDYAIELAKRFLHPGLTSEVVARGEHVRSVETNAEAFRLARVFNDVGDLFETMPETRTLPGRCFERDPRFHFRNSAKHAIDRRDNLFETGFFARAEMRTRMQNQKWQLELIGASELFRQCAN